MVPPVGESNRNDNLSDRRPWEDRAELSDAKEDGVPSPKASESWQWPKPGSGLRVMEVVGFFITYSFVLLRL